MASKSAVPPSAPSANRRRGARGAQPAQDRRPDRAGDETSRREEGDHQRGAGREGLPALGDPQRRDRAEGERQDRSARQRID